MALVITSFMLASKSAESINATGFTLANSF